MIRLPVVRRDAGAFATAQRNLDAIPLRSRDHWASAVAERRAKSTVPLPERVIVELANTCNLDCPMCRVGEHGVDLRRVMPFDRFAVIARELLSRVRDVRLNGLGETTLVPDLPRYLDLLDDTSVHLELITNGTGPIEIYSRILARGGTVLVSWDAATPATFEKVRRPARFEDARARLHEMGAEAARARGRMLLLFTLQPATTSELPGVISIASEVGAAGVIVNVAKLPDPAWLERAAPTALESFGLATSSARELGVELHLPDHLGRHEVRGAAVARTPQRKCQRPWREVVVRWDGAVQVCNMFNPYVYGHLDVIPFERIWNGAFAAAFRELVHGDHAHPYCDGCYYLEDVYERRTG